jgi:hypothetical protein
MHPNDDNKKGNMVPVDAPENKGEKPEGGKVDEGHEMVQHQLNNLKQNVDTLLEHMSQCDCPHVQEEEVKKKITLATDYLDSARDYVMSSHGDGEHDEHDEHDDGGGFMVAIEKRLSK